MSNYYNLPAFARWKENTQRIRETTIRDKHDSLYESLVVEHTCGTKALANAEMVRSTTNWTFMLAELVAGISVLLYQLLLMVLLCFDGKLVVVVGGFLETDER